MVLREVKLNCLKLLALLRKKPGLKRVVINGSLENQKPPGGNVGSAHPAAVELLRPRPPAFR